MKIEITPKGGSNICPVFVELEDPKHVSVMSEALLVTAVSAEKEAQDVLESVLLQNNLRALNRYDGKGVVRLGCSDIQPHNLIASLLDLSARELRNFGCPVEEQDAVNTSLSDQMECLDVGLTAQEMAEQLGRLSCEAATFAINIDRSRTVLVQ